MRCNQPSETGVTLELALHWPRTTTESLSLNKSWALRSIPGMTRASHDVRTAIYMYVIITHPVTLSLVILHVITTKHLWSSQDLVQVLDVITTKLSSLTALISVIKRKVLFHVETHSLEFSMSRWFRRMEKNFPNKFGGAREEKRKEGSKEKEIKSCKFNAGGGWEKKSSRDSWKREKNV